MSRMLRKKEGAIMMTRKNYTRAIELLAEGKHSDVEFETLTSFLVKFFQEDNPRFDEVNFLMKVALHKKLLNPVNIVSGPYHSYYLYT